MTKREYYDLQFYSKIINGKRNTLIEHKKGDGGPNSVLTFVGDLSLKETNGLVYDLTKCILHQANVDEGFFSDSVDHLSILYQYPNISIENIIFPMTDIKQLADEWISYITAGQN